MPSASSLKKEPQRVPVGRRFDASSARTYSEQKASEDRNFDVISFSLDQSLNSCFGIDPSTSDDPIISGSNQSLASYFENSLKKTTRATAPILPSKSSHQGTPKRVEPRGRTFSKPIDKSSTFSSSDNEEIGEGALAGRAAAAMEFSGYESERARLEALDRNTLDYPRARKKTLWRTAIIGFIIRQVYCSLFQSISLVWGFRLWDKVKYPFTIGK